MFDFWKEVVINSEFLPVSEGTDTNEKTNDPKTGAYKKFYAFTSAEDVSEGALEPKDGIFRVLRCADYSSEGVVDKTVHVTVGRYGEVAKVTFDFAAEGVDMAEGQYRILVDISLENRYYSDYKYPWSEFHKPIMVEFSLDATEGTTEAVEKAIKALKLAIPSDYKYAVAKGTGAELTISCTDPYQVIKMAKLQKLDPDGLPHCRCNEEDYVTVVAEGLVTIEKNKTPFATGEWIQENLRFPTYPNLRYASPNSDELPVPGALYTQFTFGYCSPRRGLTGQGTVGQMLASVTHHVFYVIGDAREKDSVAGKFKDALEEAGLTTDMIQTLSILNGVTRVDGLMNVSVKDVNNGKVSLKATYSEETGLADVTPAANWEVVSGPFAINADQQLVPAEGASVKAGDTGEIKVTYKGSVDTAVVEVK